MSESRKFSVHPEIIYSLIKAQAGTLAKAILESIMNSIDAGATQVTIDLTRTKLKIVDDGHGFRSRQEIEECFEVFGFPHEVGSRVYGQFGIGRAQMWAFCSTIWRTNTFRMDVDIKNRGLDYDLKENQAQVDGLTIDAKLYTAMTSNDVATVEKELQDLALFAQIPVILNGKTINRDPGKEKWNFDTEDAWIKLSDSSYLTVYNLGVLVKRFYAGYTGVGGLVVTKPGVRLALNMARNDILESECKVWARIKPFIQKKSDDKVRAKATKLTDVELENRAQRFASGDLEYKEVEKLRFITDITNRSHTLEQFVNTRRGAARPIFTLGQPGSALAERAHMTKCAFVIHPKTLVCFGVDTLDEFREKILACLKGAPRLYRYEWFKKEAIFEADLSKAVPHLSNDHDIVPANEVTAKEKAVLYGLSYIDNDLRHLLDTLEDRNQPLKSRMMQVGISDSADAWTDGRNYIALTRKVLAYGDAGFGGMLRLISLLAHEYMHDEPSTGTHTHDETFFHRFHSSHVYSNKLGNLAFKAYSLYVRRLQKQGFKPSKIVMEAIVFMESLSNQLPAEGEVPTVFDNSDDEEALKAA